MATIIGSYDLRLIPSSLYTSVTVGASATFTAEITNIGQSSVTSLYLSVDNVPEGWEPSITPVQVESLKPLDSVTFSIIVDTPAETVAGDYLITLMGISDQVASDDVEIRGTTSASTSWGLIGIGVAVVAIVGLILVFRRFKRR